MELIAEGLSRLFEEIRVKENISDLRPEYQKVTEWAKIEYPPELPSTNLELPRLSTVFLWRRITLRSYLLKLSEFMDYSRTQS